MCEGCAKIDVCTPFCAANLSITPPFRSPHHCQCARIRRLAAQANSPLSATSPLSLHSHSSERRLDAKFRRNVFRMRSRAPLDRYHKLPIRNAHAIYPRGCVRLRDGIQCNAPYMPQRLRRHFACAALLRRPVCMCGSGEGRERAFYAFLMCRRD